MTAMNREISVDGVPYPPLTPEQKAYASRIAELECALEDIAGYTTIYTPTEVTEIINRVLKREEEK